MSKEKGGIIITIVLMALVMFFLIASDYYTWKYESEGVRVDGTVTDCDFGTGRRNYNITVSYNVDGVDYECYFNNVKGRPWHDGDRVELYYLGGEPGGEVYFASKKVKCLWIMPGIVIAFLLLKLKSYNSQVFKSEIADELIFGEEQFTSEERDRRFLDSLQARYRK